MMKKNRLFCRSALFLSLLLLFALVFTGCSDQTTEGTSEEILELDLQGCTVATNTDTHGGFHGDGETVVILTWEDSSAVEKQIAQSSVWNSLPLNDDLQSVFYGTTWEEDGMMYSRGPLAADEDRTPLFPTVENGYYFFLDRSDGSRNQRSTEGLWNRYSFNFTAALYDADRGALYYYALDT